MTNPRENRGTGNGGKAYRESSFWDNIKKKEQKDDSSPNSNKGRRP